MSAKSAKVPPELRRGLERYLLLRRSELDRLDSEFHAQFAQAAWPHAVELLEADCLTRFDSTTKYLRPFRDARRPEGVSEIERLLGHEQELVLEFLRQVLAPSRSLQKDVLSRVALQLSARALSYLSEARLMLYDAPPQRTVTARVVEKPTIDRRKALVSAYCRRESMTMADLARRVGISQTTIRGVVKEDQKRFGPDSRRDLLQALHVTEEEWYRP